MELAGRPDLTPDQITRLESLLKQRAGQPFSLDNVNASAEALKSSGIANDVRLNVAPETTGIRISFVLEPAYYIGVYKFPGALRGFPYSRLLQIANYPMQGPYSPVSVETARVALETNFRRSGYFESHVQASTELDHAHHVVNVVFQTDLNRRAKFGTVEITGVSPAEAASLKHSLKTIWARLRGDALIPGKKYYYGRLQSAETYLQNKLSGKGYLAAQVALTSAEYTAETNRADISFNIETGPKISVKAKGAHLWSWTLHSLVPLYQDNQYNNELVQEGANNIESYFQKKGYFNASVEPNVTNKPNRIDIVYVIHTGPRHKVVDVDITGNKAIDEKELMSHVAVKKSRFPLFFHGDYGDQLVQQSVNNLKGVYRNAGFSQVNVTPVVRRPNGNVDVSFKINEGQRDTVRRFAVNGGSVPTSQLAPSRLEEGEGKPYSPYLVNQDRNQILAHYLSSGYLTATFDAKATPVAKGSHEYDLVYQIHEGPQVTTATVVTLGKQQTNQVLIDHTVKIKSGQPLSENDMLSAESRLYNIGIFDWAEVDTKKATITQNDSDVLVKLHEAKHNAITYGFGFEVINRGGSVPGGTVAVPGIPPVGLPNSFKTSEKTFWGPRGLFEYTRKNLRGRAESFTVGGFAGRLDQRAYTSYGFYSFRNSVWSATASANFEHNSQNPVYTERLAQAGIEFRRPLDAKRTKYLYLRYTLQKTDLTRLLIPDLVPPGDRNLLLSTLTASYIRDTRDNPLDAHKGIYQSFEADITPTALGSSVNFARLVAQTAYYKNIGFNNIIWANSIRIGLEQQFAGSHVPLSEKFFTGGGSTLRGFPLNGAGPQRTIAACGDPANPSTCSQIQVPTGGNELFILNSEFRIPVPLKKGLGVAAFYDGGNVFPYVGFNDFFSTYSNNIGIGLRYSTPVGPIRIDIGRNLNPIPGIKATQVFVTLGQAF